MGQKLDDDKTTESRKQISIERYELSSRAEKEALSVDELKLMKKLQQRVKLWKALSTEDKADKLILKELNQLVDAGVHRKWNCYSSGVNRQKLKDRCFCICKILTGVYTGGVGCN